MPRKIIVNLRRHADRKDSTKTGLNQAGINRSRKFGAKLFGPNTKLYFGTAVRNQSTARFILQKAKVIKFVPRKRNELTTSALKREEWHAIVKKMGGKEKATRAWLDGKVPADVVLPPRIAADRIIKRKLKLAWKLIKSGKTKVKIENISHQENQQAVMERLLGFSSEKLLNKKPIKPLERIKFTFVASNPIKLTMTFRGQSFDVTKRFERIIALEKSQEGKNIKDTKIKL